jgi:hypothetical protein
MEKDFNTYSSNILSSINQSLNEYKDMNKDNLLANTSNQLDPYD